jgi:hypothetical protein
MAEGSRPGLAVQVENGQANIIRHPEFIIDDRAYLLVDEKALSAQSDTVTMV